MSRAGRRRGRPARGGGRGARRARKVARRKKRRRHLTPPAAPPPPRRSDEADRLPPALGLLEVAVPLWIDRFRELTPEQRETIRRECLGVLCTGEGDPTNLGGVANLAAGTRGKPGQVALAFNALAKALALGAFQPGGVTFCGMRWEAREE